MALTDKLSAIGNAIRAKTGGSGLLTLDQMPTEIASINTGISLDDVVAHNNISGSITLPTADTIGAMMFAGTPITEIHAPNVTRFYSNTSTQTGYAVFRDCKNLSVVDMPNLYQCGSGGYQFSGCTSLTHIFLPKFTSGQYCFNGCSYLLTAVLGGTSQMNGYDYVGCNRLQIVDIAHNKVHTCSFQRCTALKTIIIRKSDDIATLSNINAFAQSPFASGYSGGKLYVPQALIEEYEAATNWVTILGYPNNQILPIEGSIYATQYGDGTPIPTT